MVTFRMMTILNSWNYSINAGTAVIIVITFGYIFDFMRRKIKDLDNFKGNHVFIGSVFLTLLCAKLRQNIVSYQPTKAATEIVRKTDGET